MAFAWVSKFAPRGTDSEQHAACIPSRVYTTIHLYAHTISKPQSSESMLEQHCMCMLPCLIPDDEIFWVMFKFAHPSSNNAQIIHPTLRTDATTRETFDSNLHTRLQLQHDMTSSSLAEQINNVQVHWTQTTIDLSRALEHIHEAKYRTTEIIRAQMSLGTM